MKRLIQIGVGLLITAGCLFYSSGCWDWWNGWILLGLNLAGSLASMLVLAHNPELAAERSNVRAGKGWDKILVLFVVLLGPVGTWITAGLEVRCHSLSRGPSFSSVFAALAGLACLVLVAWAMRANRFFSAVVRIQRDRRHVVVQSGPYRFVRHPGYAGISAFMLLTPLILGSRWALYPAFLTVAANLLRTALEDRTLRNELEGYADYVSRVRYRLLPLLW